MRSSSGVAERFRQRASMLPSLVQKVLVRGVLSLLFSVVSLAGAEGPALFPEPLHLTRRIEDSLSDSALVIEEYYQGNRVVSVRLPPEIGPDSGMSGHGAAGNLVTIVDYSRGEVVRIDREARTYSITSFEAIAAAKARAGSRAQSASDWTLTRGVGSPRRATLRRKVQDGDLAELEVTTDPAVILSRGALDVITGSAYPSATRAESAGIAEAARLAVPSTRMASQSAPSAVQDTGYALPVGEVLTVRASGDEFHFSNVVTRIGKEPVPESLLIIPSGARRVELPLLGAQSALDELDTLPKREVLRP